MSARDDVRKWMIADNADELLDAYAHELAEEGRKVMGPRALPSGVEPDSIRRYVAGWHDAMDHVDPEVSTNG